MLVSGNVNGDQPRRSNTSTITRGHSCFSCYQRKVKCDGKRPCSACIKSSISSACRSMPRRSKAAPRTREAPTASYHYLSTRLKRLEEILDANGIQTVEARSTTQSLTDREGSASPGFESDDGHMIVQHGKTRYVENALWNGLGNESLQFVDIPHEPKFDDDDDDGVHIELLDEQTPLPETLILGRTSSQSLSNLHPTIPQIIVLWSIFLTNVDPLIKVFHAPSIQQMVSEAVTDLEAITTSQEALLLSIYLSAVATIDDEECVRVMGQRKTTLWTKFSNATQQALINAGFLRCTDLMILQALTLYLLASRNNIDSQSLWLLSGIANRICQTMGLHRESGLRRLSPFEAEIGRRVWWQVLMLDNQSAQLSGVTIDAASSYLWDTRRPLNVSDSVLSPHMQWLPKEHDGPTEMVFCTVRTEIGDCIRQIRVLEKDAKATRSTCVPLKLRMIDDCESKIAQGILRKLDPSIPLHIFTTYLARSAFCQMRLSAGHPRHYPDKGAFMAQGEKESLIHLALEVVVYDRLTHSTKSLKGYLWHVVTHFPFEALILILTELLTGVKGETVNRSWVCVDQAYEDHPEFIDEASDNQLYFALGNLTLKSWNRRIKAALEDEGGSYRRSMSLVVSKLEAQRMPHTPGLERGSAASQFEARMADAASGIGGVNDTKDHAQSYESGFINGSDQQSLVSVTDYPDMAWDDWTKLLEGPSDQFLFDNI